MGEKSNVNSIQTKFIPVFGKSEQIKEKANVSGAVYFESDTGKILVDMNGERIPFGGGGVQVLYCNALNIGENVDGSYLVSIEDLEDETAKPKTDDLVINTDGRFFKVIYTNEEDGTMICSLLAISGSGGGGTGPGDTATIKLEQITGVRGPYIFGQPAYIKYKTTATEDYTVTYLITVQAENGIKKTYQKTADSGAEFSFDIGSVLYEGTNRVVVTVTGANSGSTSRTYNSISCIRLVLQESSEFNPLLIFTGAINFKCRPVGYGLSKTLRVYVDDSLYETIATNRSGEDISVDITGLKHGSHRIKATLSTGEGALETFANELNYEIAYAETGNNTPIIWLQSYPETIGQYDKLNIRYKVYNPANPAKAEVRLYINQEELPTSPVEVSYISSDLKWEQWLITKHTVGPNNYTLVCGSTTSNLEILVEKDSERELEILQTGLLVNLDASGRSNQENKASREQWKYTNKSGVTTNVQFNNFNWYNNGWIIDKEYGAALRISNGASISIPLNVLYSQSLSNSLTFEFQFKIRNVQNYNTLITTETQEDSEGNVTVIKTVNTEEGVCGNYFNRNIGLCIGTQEAFFKSQNAIVSARYKEDVLINLAFVIESMNEGRAPLIYIYINGLMSGIASYTNSDSFEAAIKELTFNSEYCDIDLFKLRVYETRLSQQNIVHNYAVDMLDVDIYDMNQIAIYNNNIPQIDFNKMLTYNVEHPDAPIMPYAVIKMVDGDERLPYVKDEDGRTCDIKFVNPSLDRAYELKEITDAEYIMGCPSFDSTGVNLNVQGTSSQGYPRRNFKAKFKKAKTWNYSKGPAAGQSLLNDITVNGETYKNYYMDNDYAENAFTWKADYMESSGTHNTGFTSFVKKLYSKHPLEDYMPEGFDPGQHRTTIYGFPMLVFQQFADNSYEFIGKYNFNLDKSCPNVIGYTLGDKHPILTDKTIKQVAECWEFCNNQGDRCSFTKVNFDETSEKDGKLTVLDDFEVRYHNDSDAIEEAYKTYPEISEANKFILSKYENLRKVADWLYSTDVQNEDVLGAELSSPITYGETVYTHDTKEYRLAKFAYEFKDHFDEEYCFVYFIMTELLLMYDSRGKNCMLSSWGPQKPGGEYIWYPIFYDSDTQLGVNNSGVPTWEYFVEATATGQFSTSNSVLWNNLWACYSTRIMETYKNLRDAAGKLNFDTLNGYYDFNPQVSGSYAMKGERPLIAYNVDEYFKYIAPTYDGYLNTSGELAYDSGRFFYCLQGSRELQRELFLRNRFNFIDSQWLAGSYSPGVIKNEIWMRFNANAYEGTSDKYLDAETLPSGLEGKMELSPFGTNPLDAIVEFNVEPYLSQYVSFQYDDTQYSPTKFDGENPVELQLPEAKMDAIKASPNTTQQLLYIGGAEFISSLGDLSTAYLDEFIVSKAKRLKDITLGNDLPGYYNSLIKDNFVLDDSAYNSNGEINANAKTLLETVVLSNISSLAKDIDLTGSEKLKTFRALGTQIPNVSFADGVQLETVYLPKTVQALNLVEPVALQGILTSKPGLDFPKGLYIENVTDAIVASDSKTLMSSIHITGGQMGYDSYRILNKLINIKKQMQNNSSLENIYNKDLKIRLEKVHWSPYSLLQPGEVYNNQLSYRMLTDHYTFVEYIYSTKEKWENDLLNGRVYLFIDTANKNLLTDLSMLETFIESYNSENNYFKDTLAGIDGINTLPYLSGDIFINNTTPISETDLKNIYKDTYYPDLNIYVANIREAYTAKFVEIYDNGVEHIVDMLKYEPGSVEHPGMTSKEPTKLHYDFKGWAAIPNGTVDDIITDFSQYTFSEDNTLFIFYAVYDRHPYTISFKNWDGSLLEEKTVLYNDSFNEYAGLPYKDDSKLELEKTYAFKGWTDDKTKTEVSNEDELENILVDISTYKAIKDYEFYAVFKEDSVYNNILDSKFLDFSFLGSWSDPSDSQYDVGTSCLIKAKANVSLTGKITLPTEYIHTNGNVVPVVGVARDGFSHNAELTHIFWDRRKAPLVRVFNDYAFSFCDNLVYLEYPSSLRVINTSGLSVRSNKGLINHDFAHTKLDTIGASGLNQSFKENPETHQINLRFAGSLRRILQDGITYNNGHFASLTFGGPNDPSMLAELGSNAVAQNADYKLQKVVIYCTEERLAEIEALEASGNIECAGDWQIITTNKGE